MTIDIAYYLSELERLMGEVFESAKKAGIQGGVITKDQVNILLTGALTAAKQLEEQIHDEVKQKEGQSYGVPSNEMQLLAFALMWSAYAGWVFKAKSEDPNRNEESRKQADAVSKHVETMIINAIRGGQKIGKNSGRPEGKKEPISIA
jgi:hypothetical protein